VQTPLLHHYHPAVALHARQLLTSQPLTAAPDLSLNTLSHFLDRFIYKNPKNPKPKGASAMQPSAASHAAGSAEGVRRIRGEVADSEGLMNDPKFLRRRAEDVPVDQLFFHKYFTRRKEREDARGGKRKHADSDSGDDEDTIEELSDEGDALSDDAEEAEIWKVRLRTSSSPAMKCSISITGDASDHAQGRWRRRPP
jgi:ribosome biogenesis protein MAK21